MNIYILSVFVAVAIVCVQSCGYGSCGLGSAVGGFSGCGYCQSPCYPPCPSPCDVTVRCNPCLQAAILAPLNGCPFCGPCCDPIAACCLKKLRDYKLLKQKFLAKICLDKNFLASKFIC